MTYSLKYSPLALETLNDIAAQVNNRWGEKYAIEFKNRAVKVVETICTAPFIFQTINSKIDVRKGFIHRNCSVFYEVRDTTIEILFFWDNRQDPIFL
jgi:plasmid stabilization system protein ParE